MMRLSVCLRCGTVFRFKLIDEVIGVFVARFQSNFMNFFPGGEQQIFCGFHPFFVEVFKRRQSENGRKLAADTVFAHMTALLQIVQSDMACQMIVHIMLELSQVGSACPVLVFQMEHMNKEFR